MIKLECKTLIGSLRIRIMKAFFVKYRILLVTVCVLLLIATVLQALYAFNVIPHPMLDGAHFGIEAYKSRIDRDSDGLDDQSDILAGVRAYISTEPQYMSKYYGETGWPDDEYGVCTDVVARGLLAAGYDLMTLMAEDIAAHPERYGDDVGDPMIDFRRVRNQLPFFEGNAISLTTDIGRIEEWQGGDIVVFPGHVGIVSDKRNVHGVPFVIHHGSPEQRSYEEDVLGRCGEIVGHFRIS